MAQVKQKLEDLKQKAEQQDERMRQIYKEQKKVGLLSFLAELPNFAAVLVSAVLSRSLIMWLDLVDSFSNIARSSSVFLSSGKLEGRNVEDPEKLEFRVALFCDLSVLTGLLILLFTSVSQVLHPEEPKPFLLAAVGLKAVNVTVDVFMFVRQARILKQGETAIVRAEYNGLLKDTIFDSATLVVILLCFLLIRYPWSWYISPVLCVVMCLFFLGKYANDMRILVRQHRDGKET